MLHEPNRLDLPDRERVDALYRAVVAEGHVELKNTPENAPVIRALHTHLRCDGWDARIGRSATTVVVVVRRATL